MFPLSDEEDLALGWIDMYGWQSFETEVVPEVQSALPRLIYISHGSRYTLYEGDLYDLAMIQGFLNHGLKD